MHQARHSLTPISINPLNMTVVINDPSVWALINYNRIVSYFIVAASTAVAYDSALIFGQEFELVWRQRWSLMTVVYLSLRFAGALYSVMNLLSSLPSFSMTDTVSTFIAFSQLWVAFVANGLLNVVIVARLHAMYQQSRKMLTFLVTSFLVIMIACGLIIVIQESSYMSGEEVMLSGTYLCNVTGPARVLTPVSWILATVWELLALFLVVWIVVKQIRELKRWTIEGRLSALVKTQMLYFAAFIAAACLTIGLFSPNISNSYSAGTEIYAGALEILQILQICVLGPRLVLNVREYNAKSTYPTRQVAVV
ncbi:uncharacterized protein EDB91DRAFT_893829 [Suillus paluster]|uniref:uncharacterized protein n=1 Tax=Suillus paluster TaxID=48578 RepID=UPI001B885838|nr:uncharacterized protein EDB91DRAFT_893829 [Suillus paluster]KAG1727274.1 hypothetical protein EDB91DRAFT_893829 [Suillus paluster]